MTKPELAPRPELAATKDLDEIYEPEDPENPRNLVEYDFKKVVLDHDCGKFYGLD